MAVEQDGTLATTRSLAVYVAGAPAKKDIDAVVANLTPESVPLLVARAKALRKALAYIEQACEGRITAEFILKFGDEWIDPDTGVIFEFKGEQVKEVGDYDGLRAALLAAGVPEDVVNRAVYSEPKANLRELATIAKRSDRCREIVDDFVSVRYRPAHLNEKEK